MVKNVGAIVEVTNNKALINRIVKATIPKSTINFLNIRLFECGYIIVNVWDILHFFSGVLFRYIFGDNIILFLILHTLWEILELILVNIPPRKTFLHGIEFVNTLVDTVFAVAGFYFADFLIEE